MNAQKTDPGHVQELNPRSDQRHLNIPDHGQKTYLALERAPKNAHHPGRTRSGGAALAPNRVQAVRKLHIALDLRKMFPVRARMSKFTNMFKFHYNYTLLKFILFIHIHINKMLFDNFF